MVQKPLIRVQSNMLLRLSAIASVTARIEICGRDFEIPFHRYQRGFYGRLAGAART